MIDRRAASRLVSFERLSYRPDAWERIVAGHPEAEVFHGAPWLAFLASSQGAEPVVAVVTYAGRPVGHFVGGIVRRYGLRILGSPLRGWGTAYMGFLLEDGTDRRAVAEALPHFAFHGLGCHHVELADRRLTAEQMEGSGYRVERGITYVVDLDDAEDRILDRMHPKTRQYIRKAMRAGLCAEVVNDAAFADEYHEQLTDVFARQGLAPTYGVERVRQLIDALLPSGQLLLLRVRSAEGDRVASAIVVGRNQTAVNWGAASFHEKAGSHPNQLLWWEAMRHWRARGARQYDMGGAGDYKAKYGSVIVPRAGFHRSRYAGLRYGRAAVRQLVRTRQVLAGLRRSRPSDERAGEGGGV